VAHARRHLSLVPTTAEAARPSQWFCGHCGAITSEAPAPVARVCGVCELGLLMEASADLVPRPREPYLIVDTSLAVRALSAEAAAFLATSESEALDRPVTDLLVPADAEAASAHHFAQTIMHVAAGDDELRRLTVRPVDVFGVRMPLRVGVCGPPRGALLVIE
jgi:hypothetical protein